MTSPARMHAVHATSAKQQMDAVMSLPLDRLPPPRFPKECR